MCVRERERESAEVLSCVCVCVCVCGRACVCVFLWDGDAVLTDTFDPKRGHTFRFYKNRCIVGLTPDFNKVAPPARTTPIPSF